MSNLINGSKKDRARDRFLNSLSNNPIIPIPSINFNNAWGFHNDWHNALSERFDKVFADVFSDSSLQSIKTTLGYPKFDIGSEGENWVIKAAVPGVNEKDLNVEIYAAPDNPKSKIVTISGEMQSEYKSPEGAEYQVRELHRSKFSRSVTLPDDVEGDPTAELKQGILVLKWKQKKEIEETIKPKQIEVKKVD